MDQPEIITKAPVQPPNQSPTDQKPFSPPPVQSPQPSPQPKSRFPKLIIFTLIFIAISASGVAAYFFYQNQQQQSQLTNQPTRTPSPSSTASPLPTPSPTTAWQTYNFISDNFSIKLPSDWIVSGELIGPSSLLSRLNLPQPLSEQESEEIKQGCITIKVTDRNTVAANDSSSIVSEKTLPNTEIMIVFSAVNSDLENILDQISDTTSILYDFTDSKLNIFSDNKYGFSFSFPDNLSIEEKAGSIILHKNNDHDYSNHIQLTPLTLGSISLYDKAKAVLDKVSLKQIVLKDISSITDNNLSGYSFNIKYPNGESEFIYTQNPSESNKIVEIVTRVASGEEEFKQISTDVLSTFKFTN